MALIQGNDAANALDGTGSADTVLAKGGNDVVFGFGGNDSIYGGAGNDDLYGLGDNDTIEGGAGADLIDGGDGTDTASYASSAGGVYADLDLGIGILADAAGDTYAGVENLIGSSLGDLLYGDDVGNRIQGAGGNDNIDGRTGSDSLEGGADHDTVVGGEGADLLNGGAGADQLFGGAGFDTASYAGASNGVLVDLTNGQRTFDATGDVFSSIEKLVGSSHADTFRGNAAADVFFGSGGADILSGEGGADDLEGQGGGDLIWGSLGNDFMSGGAGADEFLFTSLGDSGVSVATRDLIWDFKPGQNDLINLANIDARAGNPTNDAFTFIGDDAFSAAGQLRYFHSGGSTVVELNVSGGDTAEMQISLAGLIDLQAGDFLL